MAGIVGLIGENSNKDSLTLTMQSLKHRQDIRSLTSSNQDGIALGMIYRHSSQADVWSELTRKLFVAIYGLVIVRNGNWQRVSARSLANKYMNNGLSCISDLDGSFSIVIVDQASSKTFIIADRFATVPIFYSIHNGKLAFGPAQKTPLQMLGKVPSPDMTGTFQYLSLGFPFGENTLISDVKRLRPGHMVEFCKTSGSVSTRKYWSIEYKPDRKLNIKQSAQLLYKAIEESQKALKFYDASSVGIALTGGYDSRIILGTLEQCENVDYRAFTWGHLNNVPLSDPVIACDIAACYGIPHHFLPYSSSSFSDNVKSWLSVSESLSDNMGFFAAGKDFIFNSNKAPEVMLIGDHLIGLSGLPVNWDDAFETALRLPRTGVLPQLAKMLRGDYLSTLVNATKGEAAKLVEPNSDNDPKEFLEKMFLEIHLPGWLLPPSFYREPMLTAFRPLMLGPVVEVMQILPKELRTDKAVLVAMLKRHLPELNKIPLASADSLIDWEYDSRNDPGLKAFLEINTQIEKLKAIPLFDILDYESFNEFRTSFFNYSSQPVSRESSNIHALIKLRRFLSRTPLTASLAQQASKIYRYYSRAGTYQRAVGSPTRLICRIAFLSSFWGGGMENIRNDSFENISTR